MTGDQQTFSWANSDQWGCLSERSGRYASLHLEWKTPHTSSSSTSASPRLSSNHRPFFKSTPEGDRGFVVTAAGKQKRRFFNWHEDCCAVLNLQQVPLLCCPLTPSPEGRNWSLTIQLPVATGIYVSRHSAMPHKHFNFNFLFNVALPS